MRLRATGNYFLDESEDGLNITVFSHEYRGDFQRSLSPRSLPMVLYDGAALMSHSSRCALPIRAAYRALLAMYFDSGSVHIADGRTGEAGAPGAQGPPGSQGSHGPQAPTGQSRMASTFT